MTYPVSVAATIEPRDIDADVSAMIGVIEDLLGVIDQENRALAVGSIASLPGTAARKAALARDLQTNIPPLLAAAPPHLRARLSEASRSLATATQENITRIKAAMGATGSRVNAIMSAIREQVETDITYRADGTVGAAPRRPALNAGLLA